MRALGMIAAPLIYWAYVPPSDAPWWKFRMLWERQPLSSGIDGVLCLTPLCAAASASRWPWARVRFVDWGADSVMFPGSNALGEYFFACGRTNRDYATLLAAASRVNTPVALLVSRSFLQGLEIPPNVTLLQGPAEAATDKGVSYAEVVALYANARAVLICRRDVAGDTSGLTNLLEALAMGRPTAITRTGALDLDVEQAGVGRFIAPGDVQGWAQLMTDWSSESDELRAMRARARQVVDEHYNHIRHGRDVTMFVADLLRRGSSSVENR
jgi:glycosyltransferase involved in cell wall biosynthesis